MALSRSGTWLAAGTAQGNIAVWDLRRPDVPLRIAFRHDRLNDLQFSPDEQMLAIAAQDLGTYKPAQPGLPRTLCADQANYGSARFRLGGQNLLAVTGASIIELLDAHTGVVRFKLCCSSIWVMPF